MKDRKLRTSVVSLILAVVVIPLLAVQGDGRDFAGLYAVTSVTDLGEQVRLTLNLRVHNDSGADVIDATVSLEHPLLQTVYGSSSGVSIAAGESARFSGTFILPRHEYDYWEKGGVPHLLIGYPDANGNPVQRTIEVAPGLLPDQEEQ